MEYIFTKIPRVNKVLGCCDLKTGNKMIAWVIIFINAVAILATWVIINEDEQKAEELIKKLPDELDGSTKKLEESLDFVLAFYGIAMTIGYILFCLVNYFFIKGIKEANTLYMLPYMTIHGLPAIFCIAIAFSCVLLIPFYLSNFGYIILFMFAFGFFGAISGCIFIFAYSLYKEIEEDNSKRLQGLGGGLNL